ncbi:MAG TPA: response regulator [Kofleriaceae bacterium]|nr:response regulator [Kofleriaceae bacterium]
MSNKHLVFVIEDDLDIRCSIVELLEESGYHTVGAENGAAALELLRAADRSPCLILLDLMMPIMDGETFHGELRKQPGWSTIPVILMSAYRDVAERAARMQVEHLVKPVGVDELLEVTRRYCRRI